MSVLCFVMDVVSTKMNWADFLHFQIDLSKQATMFSGSISEAMAKVTVIFSLSILKKKIFIWP